MTLTPAIGNQWGTGTGNHGLGQSTAAITAPGNGVASGNPITAIQWNNLLSVVNNCLQHEGQAPITPPSVTTQTLVTAFPSLSSGTSTAYNNSGSTGLALVTGTPSVGLTSTSWALATFTQTVTFSTGDAARYFFNAGGTISINFGRTGGTSSTADANFDALCAACGTITLGYANTTKTGGSGTPTTLLNSGNGGYWSGTAIDVIHFKQFNTISSYTTDYIQVEYHWSGTVANGGSPTLNIKVTYQCNAHVQDGTTSVTITPNAPSTAYLTNTWGTPTYGTWTINVSGGGALAAPLNTVLPVITGAAKEGVTLSSTLGTWTGNPVPTYSYQWKSLSTGPVTSINVAALPADFTADPTGTNLSFSSGAAAAYVNGAYTNGSYTSGPYTWTSSGSLPGTWTVAPNFNINGGGSYTGGSTWNSLTSPYSIASVGSYSVQNGSLSGVANGTYGTGVLSSTTWTSFFGAGVLGSNQPSVSVTVFNNAITAVSLIGGGLFQGDPYGSPGGGCIVPLNSGSTYCFVQVGSSTTNTSQGSFVSWSSSNGTASSTNTFTMTVAGGTGYNGAANGQIITVYPTGTTAYYYGVNSVAITNGGSYTSAPTAYLFANSNSGGNTNWPMTTAVTASMANIALATNSTYTLTSAEVGKQVECLVYANNSQGSAIATSAVTTAVTVGPPVNNVLPVITGTPSVGQTLTTTNGSWTGTATITYARQWQKGVADIVGQTGTTYVIQAGDVGSTIRCKVTASNGQTGSPTIVYSAGTAAVANPATIDRYVWSSTGTSETSNASEGNSVLLRAYAHWSDGSVSGLQSGSFTPASVSITLQSPGTQLVAPSYVANNDASLTINTPQINNQAQYYITGTVNGVNVTGYIVYSNFPDNVVSISVDNQGSGYTSAPSISINNGGYTTRATAHANMTATGSIGQDTYSVNMSIGTYYWTVYCADAAVVTGTLHLSGVITTPGMNATTYTWRWFWGVQSGSVPTSSITGTGTIPNGTYVVYCGSNPQDMGSPFVWYNVTISGNAISNITQAGNAGGSYTTLVNSSPNLAVSGSLNQAGWGTATINLAGLSVNYQYSHDRTARVSLSDGGLFTIMEPGYITIAGSQGDGNYTIQAYHQVSASQTTYSVSSVTMDNVGAGYSSQPQVVFSGDGVNAAAHANMG